LAADAAILITTHAYTAISLARKALLGAEENPFDMLVVDEADQWANAASSVSLVSASMTDLHRSIDNVLDAGRHLKNPTKLIEKAASAIRSVEALTELAPKTPIASNSSRPTTSPLVCWLASSINSKTCSCRRRCRTHTAAVADALRDRIDDLKRIQRAVVGNETDFWDAALDDVSRAGASVDRRAGRAPGRILKRLWSGGGSSEPLAGRSF